MAKEWKKKERFEEKVARLPNYPWLFIKWMFKMAFVIVGWMFIIIIAILVFA